MNLLYLCAFVPFPPSDGDRVRALVTLKGLAKFHQIYGFFLDPDGHNQLPPEIRALCQDTEVVPVNRLWKVRGALRAWMNREPVHAGAFWSTRGQEWLAHTLRYWPVTGVHVHRLRMMPYAERLNLPYVLDATDCMSHYYQHAAKVRGWRRWYAMLDLPALKRAERRWANRAAACLVVTEVERTRLKSLGVTRPIIVVPNGLDLKFWKFSPRPPRSNTLTFLGNIAYPPNTEGLSWFFTKAAAELVRACPDAQLHVIGGGAPAWLIRQARTCPLPVRFLGYQADVQSHLKRSKVLICPLPLGVGLNNKAIQAMACGLPVVATSNVAASLSARHGVELLASDQSAAFARFTGQLLMDVPLSRKIAAGGRRLVEKRFSEALAARSLRRAYRNLSLPSHPFGGRGKKRGGHWK